jgi:CHAT domain-containing protein
MRKQTAGRTHPGKIAAVFADPVFDTTDPRLSEARAAEGGSAVDGTADRGLSLASVKQAARDTRDTPGETLIPRLSATAGESDALKRILGQSEGRYLLGFDATRTAVESPDLVQFRYVHFATHGFLNTRNPELSGLVLSLYDSKGQSTPGFLLINDVFNLRLGADLVVLSACETALGKQVRGEGLQGVTQGFFHAGTPRVIASLWKVDDRATGELMTEMYEHMVTDGERPAAALRKAQLSVWSDVKWRAPYFWAAFVAEGEWR